MMGVGGKLFIDHLHFNFEYRNVCNNPPPLSLPTGQSNNGYSNKTVSIELIAVFYTNAANDVKDYY